ncbi:hypothetical protein [Nonomuraea sp. NPDC003214]
MATYGYVAFQLRAHPRNRPAVNRYLSNLDGHDTDTFDLLKNFLKKNTGQLLTDSRYELAHRVDRRREFGRSFMIAGTSGPYGLLGNAVHLDTGAEQEIDERTAMMTSMRSMIFLPRDSYDAVIMCERVGRRSFRNAIERHILKAIGTDIGITFKVSAHVDTRAWAKFLREGHVNQITSIYRSTRIEDLGPVRGRAKDLKIAAGGIVASRIGRAIQSSLQSLTQRGGPVAFNIDEYPDLQPRNPGEYEKERSELLVESAGAERTITIEQGQLPQFIHPLNGHVPDTTLRDAWTEHAKQILSDQGVRMNP